MFDVNLLFLQLIASPPLNVYTVIPNIAKVKYSPFTSDHYSMRNSSAHENIMYPWRCICRQCPLRITASYSLLFKRTKSDLTGGDFPNESRVTIGGTNVCFCLSLPATQLKIQIPSSGMVSDPRPDVTGCVIVLSSP